MASIIDHVVDSPYRINSTFKIGTIYRISAPELIEVEVPHYFIVIAKSSSNEGFLVVTTSKLDTLINHFQKARISNETISMIRPSDENNLTKDSYINCNTLHKVDECFLINKMKKNKLTIHGYLTNAEIIQIKNAISKSKLVERKIKKLIEDSNNN